MVFHLASLADKANGPHQHRREPRAGNGIASARVGFNKGTGQAAPAEWAGWCGWVEKGKMDDGTAPVVRPCANQPVEHRSRTSILKPSNIVGNVDFMQSFPRLPYPLCHLISRNALRWQTQDGAHLLSSTANIPAASIRVTRIFRGGSFEWLT